MADTTTQGAFLATFRAQLAERAALADVTVTSAFMGVASTPGRWIQLIGTEMDQQWDTIGNIERHEIYTATGIIEVMKRGTTEADATAARDGAEALLNEVQQQLWDDPTVGGSVFMAKLTAAQLDQGYNADGRLARYEFTIEVEAYLQR